MYSLQDGDFDLTGYDPHIVDPMHDTKSIIKYLVGDDPDENEFRRDPNKNRETKKSDDRVAPIKKKLITILHDDLNAESEASKANPNTLYTISNNNKYDASTMSIAARNLQRMRQVKRAQLRRFDQSSQVLDNMENQRQTRI